MEQLAVPILVMTAASLALALLGVRLGRTVPRPVGLGLCAVAVGLMLLHAIYLGDNLVLAQLVPVPDVLVWGNLQPVAAGVLAGLAWSTLGTPRWQRGLLVTAVAMLALYRAYWPIAGSCPRTGDTWFGDVCKQSTLSTCSAAAAATALRAVGINASESEMARLCLTREAGTTNLGLYRGLRRKTDGTPLRVQIFTGDAQALLRQPGPSIVSIGSTLRQSSGWVPLIGNRHSVVVLGALPDGGMEVADPYTGQRQRYSVSMLESAWDGRAIRLVAR